MTIALISNLYPPYIVGGYEILAHDMTEGLRARGHTVHVITGRGADLPQDGYTHPALDIDLDRKGDYFLGGLPLTAGRLVNWHLFNTSAYRNVKATLDKIQPNLVIAWNLYMASAAPLVAARIYGRAPVVAYTADKWLMYSLNDIGALVPATSWQQRAFIGGLRRGVQPVLRRMARPDYILAVSEFIRNLHCTAGYARAQTVATYLGIHTECFTYTTHAYPGQRTWRLLYAGQLWEGKGPDVAIEALALLRSRGDVPPVELDIYGGGTDGYLAHLREKIAALGLEPWVQLRGFAPRDELAVALKDHDAFLFCSIWDEPFSVGLQEAMGTGLPTIATTTGGTPEGVRHGETGLLIPPDDPQALADMVVRLMQDPELYKRLSETAGAEVAQRWTIGRWVDRVEGTCQAIVAGHRRGAPIDITRTR